MKKLLMVISVFMIASCVYTENFTISFEVPDAKRTKAFTGFLKLHPNAEMKPDPAWVDPKDGSQSPLVPAYTDEEWMVERSRLTFVREVHRGNQQIREKAAKEPIDDDVARIKK